MPMGGKQMEKRKTPTGCKMSINKNLYHGDEKNAKQENHDN